MIGEKGSDMIKATWHARSNVNHRWEQLGNFLTNRLRNNLRRRNGAA